MNVRAKFGWLLLAGLLIGRSAGAQGWGPMPASPAPTGMVTTQHYMPSGALPPGHPYCPPDPGSYNGIMAQLVPDNDCLFYDNDSRLDLVLRETLRGTWFRLEYFNGRLSRSGGGPLGAPRAGVRNIGNPFPIEFPDEDVDDEEDPITGFAIVPSSASANFGDVQGIRGSLGIPLTKEFSIEASFFGMENQAGSIQTPGLRSPLVPGVLGEPPISFLATTLTTNGQPGDRVILYDSNFFSNYTADLWSTNVNLVYNFRAPLDEGLVVQPLIGYRHEEYGERLTFGGQFDNRWNYYPDVGILDPPQSNRIDSKVRNFRNQLQLGLRSELKHRWFTLGAEPKIALGSNLVRSQVRVADVREPGNLEFLDPDEFLDDPELSISSGREIHFAPTFDLNLYASVNITDWLKLRAGYNLVWMGRMGAADDSIRFNEVTDPDTLDTIADVGLRSKLRSRTLSAFTIGGEIILP